MRYRFTLKTVLAALAFTASSLVIYGHVVKLSLPVNSCVVSRAGEQDPRPTTGDINKNNSQLSCFHIPTPLLSHTSLTSTMILLEEHYGGLNYANCAWPTQKCVGGDRMGPAPPRHNYSGFYADYLFGRDFATIAEIGILNGVGLAIWSSLYPNANIHGFDLRLENTRSNLNSLKSRGAFCSRELSLHKLDQLHVDDTVSMLNATFDFVIDDGYHTDESSYNTWTLFEPYLHSDAIYVVEDCKCESLQKRIATEYKEYAATLKETSRVRGNSFLLVITKKEPQ